MRVARSSNPAAVKLVRRLRYQKHILAVLVIGSGSIGVITAPNGPLSISPFGTKVTTAVLVTLLVLVAVMLVVFLRSRRSIKDKHVVADIRNVDESVAWAYVIALMETGTAHDDDELLSLDDTVKAAVKEWRIGHKQRHGLPVPDEA